MSDLEHEDIQQLLSVPAASIPGQVTRRRFLQGAVASAGALTVLPVGVRPPRRRWPPRSAPTTDPGRDPARRRQRRPQHGPAPQRSRYAALRGSLAVTSPLPLTSSYGLHPSLPNLKARYDAGKVAIVQGVGQTGDDHSHFSSTATWMAGTATTTRSSGWLGRWLDGVPEADAGLRAVTVGSSIPLHLSGQQAVITALDTGGELFGADTSQAAYVAAYDAISSFADTPSGKGQWGDELARAGAPGHRPRRPISIRCSRPRCPTTLCPRSSRWRLDSSTPIWAFAS